MTDREISRIADAVADRLKNGALSELHARLDRQDAVIASMAEDVAKIPLIEGELRLLVSNVTDIRNHWGV